MITGLGWGIIAFCSAGVFVLVCAIISMQKKKGSGTPPPVVATPTSAPRPARDWSGLWKVVRTLLVLGLICWGIYVWANKPSSPTPARWSGTTSQPKRTWVFHWSMSPGDSSEGYTESTFSADITKDDGVMLWVDLYNVRGQLVADLRLRKIEGKLTGWMRNYHDGSRTGCYLVPDGSYWLGGMQEPGHGPIVCWLRRG